MTIALQTRATPVPLAALAGKALASGAFPARSNAPTTSRDIDRLYVERFGEVPPALDSGGQVVPLADYTARLLAAAEARRPTRLCPVLYPHGFSPHNAPAYRLWLREHHVPDRHARARLSAAGAARGVALSLIMVGDAWTGHDIASTLASLEQLLCECHELIVVGSASFCARVAALTPQAVTIHCASAGACAFNAALQRCRGTFVVLLTPGMRLAMDAACHVAEFAAPATPQTAVALLVDGDGIDQAGKRHAPRFASLGWDAEAMMRDDHWTRRIVLRTASARAAGGARPDHGAHVWADLVIRVIDAAGQSAVAHIPRPLISIPVTGAGGFWTRRTAARTRQRSWRKLVADHAARRAAAIGEPAPRVVPQPGGRTRVLYALPRQPPLVSIIIPTRDRSALLHACLRGVLRRTDYDRLEVLVVDNRSVDPSTHKCFARYAHDPRLRILPFDREFNWGAINNAAVRQARGSVLVFLNNDTEVIDRGWLTELVSQAVRPEIGAVGPKLLYRNGTIQHAGLIFGANAESYHRCRHMPGNAAGYDGALNSVCEVSAVTGACLALRRSVYDEVGGIEEHALAVTWSDVDLCFRVRARGYRVIYTPHARLLHLELATRGPDTTPERAARAERERRTMLERWPALAGNDPHYNPSLHLGEGDTRVAAVPRLGALAGERGEAHAEPLRAPDAVLCGS